MKTWQRPWYLYDLVDKKESEWIIGMIHLESACKQWFPNNVNVSNHWLILVVSKWKTLQQLVKQDWKLQGLYTIFQFAVFLSVINKLVLYLLLMLARLLKFGALTNESGEEWSYYTTVMKKSKQSVPTWNRPCLCICGWYFPVVVIYLSSLEWHE